MAPTTDQDLEGNLQHVLDEFGCVAGTIHRADGELLRLVAHVGIPAAVVDRVQTFPVGKGMGGLAAERREPVQVCNLQAGDANVAEEGAQASGLQGSIAAPMLGPDGTLKGVIGIGKQEEYEFSEEEEAALLQMGRELAADW